MLLFGGFLNSLAFFAPLRETRHRPRAVSTMGYRTPMNSIRRNATMPRSKAADGLKNRFETFIMSHLSPLWRLAQVIPPLDRWLNKVLINRAVGKCPFRPNPLSMMSDYPSWDSLTDRTYS